MKQTVHPPQMQVQHFLVSTQERLRVREGIGLLYLGRGGKALIQSQSRVLKVHLDGNDSENENDNE